MSMLSQGLLVATLALGAPPALDPEQLVTAGETYVQSGQGKKATSLLQKAIAGGKLTAQQHARALTALGLARSQVDDHDGAVKYFEEAIKVDPANERAYLMLGMTYDISERFQEARATYQKGVERFPKSTNLLRELGATELLLGDAVGAVGHLEKAAQKDGEDPELLRDLGEAHLRSGNAEKAIRILQDARSLDPGNAHIAATLGDAHAAAGQTREAIKAYDEAVSLDSGHAPAWFHKGLMLAKAGDQAGAVVAYRQALKVDPSNLKARAALGVALGRVKGQEAEGITTLKQVIQKDPSFAEAHAQLGLLLEQQGDLPGAEQALQNAISRREGDPGLWEDLARVQGKRGRKKEAAQSNKTATRLREGK